MTSTYSPSAFAVTMKPYLYSYRRGCLHSIWRIRLVIPWFRIGVLLAFLLGLLSCATQKIAEGRFVHEGKGYAFLLPSKDWEIDKDAWVYEREFGHLIAKKKEPRYVLRRNQRNRPGQDIIIIRPRLPRTYKKLIMDMDIGFQHNTRPMQLLIGTISEGDLTKFLKGNFNKTDRDLPDNLIAGYLQHLQFFYSSKQSAAISSLELPHAGRANRLEWDDGQDIRVLYGIALNRNYLFFSLKANKEIPAADLKLGLQDLDRLVEACVRLPRN